MKKEFTLDSHVAFSEQPKIRIIGTKPKFKPYVHVQVDGKYAFVEDKDLERLAVNILKALKSNRLKEKKKLNTTKP